MADRFFEHPRTKATTTRGEVELPVLFRDVSSVYAFFPVELSRAEALLAGTPFAPARFGTGTAIAGLAFYDYRETSIGAYREAGLAMAVTLRGTATPSLPLLDMLRRARHRDVGFHILDLPATTPIAVATGCELWGFPQWVTEIDFELHDGGFSGIVYAPGTRKPLVTLQGTTGAALSMDSLDLLLYSQRGTELLRTVWDARGRTRTSRGRSMTVHVGDSAHALCDRLRALGLDGAHPFMAQSGDRIQTVLHAGAPVVVPKAA
jgi:hypothetical protein